MSVHLLVPAKTAGAMRRLAGVLDEDARAELMRRLLERTLAVARDAARLPITVVTAQEDARAIARRWEAVVADDPGRGPNEAVAAAAEALAAAGAAMVVVVAADLPLLDVGALRMLLRSVARDTMSIAPDRLGAGTNALACPAGRFPYAFGPDSFRVHTASAKSRGWRTAVVRTPGLAVDLDQAGDSDLIARIGGREPPFATA